MINKSGLSNLTRNLQTGKSPSSTGGKSPSSFITGRVTDIIMGESHPLFEFNDNYHSIGLIYFQTISSNKVSSKFNTAKPLFPNIKNYPLVNEIVLLLKLPIPTYGSATYQEEYYYVNSISLWNHPHHNASPDPTVSLTKESNKVSYQQTELGVPRILSTDEGIELTPPDQSPFPERENIRPLMSFTGDVIYEGRFGNSIRLGNTSKSNQSTQNPWSNSGKDGDPINIIRNGQSIIDLKEGFIPIIEDINNDLSSFYQTSTQQIPIKIANSSYNSYETPPISPETYNSSQNILNSDRIVINAKNDHTLISAQKSVGISSNLSVNIDSPQFIVDSKSIKLGGKDANEAIIKGNTLYSKLDTILNSLITLVTVLETSQVWAGGIPSPDGLTSITSSMVKSQLKEVQFSLKDILSQRNKTV